MLYWIGAGVPDQGKGDDFIDHECRCWEPPACKREQCTESWRGGVINMKIYTSSDHWSVIPDVQCGNMFPLLIFEGPSMEFVTEDITSFRVLWKWVFLCPSFVILVQLGPPFIGNWEPPAKYPFVHHKCIQQTHLFAEFVWVPASDLGVIITLYPVMTFEGSGPRENRCFLPIHDVPSVGPSTPSSRAYVSRHHPTPHPFGYKRSLWCRSLVPSHYIFRH
jgi:hypothetical protein